MAIGKILKYGIKAVKAARKAKASKDLDARIRKIHLQRDKNDIKRFGVKDPRIKNIYKKRTENRLKRYGISPPKTTRKPKRSYKSMNPIEKAVTAAKITGRGMNTFTSKGRFSKADRRFINTLYGVAGASQLIPAVRRKKK